VTLRLVLRVIAWLLFAGLIFATLSPIGMRPNSPLPTGAERAFALLLVGFVFALAYPRHILLAAILVFGSTVLLELLQLMSPSRHGRFIDVAVKLVGAGAGLALGWLVARFHGRRTDP
jgi:VanZ family protein